MAVRLWSKRARFKISAAPPEQKPWKDCKPQFLFNHGYGAKFVDRNISDVRMDLIFFQYPMHVASGRVLSDNEWSALEHFQRNLTICCKRMLRWKDGKELVIHNWEKLIILSLLITDKSDIYPAFLDPVGKLAFHAFYDLKMYIRVRLFEFPDDLRYPVDRTAEICAYFDSAYLGAL